MPFSGPVSIKSLCCVLAEAALLRKIPNSDIGKCQWKNNSECGCVCCFLSDHCMLLSLAAKIQVRYRRQTPCLLERRILVFDSEYYDNAVRLAWVSSLLGSVNSSKALRFFSFRLGSDHFTVSGAKPFCNIKNSTSAAVIQDFQRTPGCCASCQTELCLQLCKESSLI